MDGLVHAAEVQAAQPPANELGSALLCAGFATSVATYSVTVWWGEGEGPCRDADTPVQMGLAVTVGWAEVASCPSSGRQWVMFSLGEYGVHWLR